MSTAFDNLLSLTQSFEPSNGEKCNQLGNNVYQPTDGGISDFNKGVVTMSPYGSYNLTLTEAVEYRYDAQLLFDNLNPIEELFTQKLTEQNKLEMEHNKKLKSNVDYGSGIGFMQGVYREELSEDESNAIKLMQHAEHESQYPPM